MTKQDIQDVVRSTLLFLGEKYDSIDAERMLYAIGYQESRFKYREQIKGPARGFWQFEKYGGVNGVLQHTSTAKKAEEVCAYFGFAPTPDAVYNELHNSDVLAASFARLLLWTDARPLPTTEDAGWKYYLRNWRPGKPHPESWSDAWQFAERLLQL